MPSPATKHFESLVLYLGFIVIDLGFTRPSVSTAMRVCLSKAAQPQISNHNTVIVIVIVIMVCDV